MPIAWTFRYALRTKAVKSSRIRELLKIKQHPEVISFAGGLPANDLFPIERFEEACRNVLEKHPAAGLQYGETEGYEPLRDMIARHTSRYGIEAKIENVLITSGSQQALDLISRHMRLNFSNASPERIRKGIRRLSAAIKAQLAELQLEHAVAS